MYAVGDNDSNCDDLGLQVIQTVDECDDAIAALYDAGELDVVNSAVWALDSTTNYVGGCSVKSTENNMRHWNGNLDHTGTRSSERPVCKCVGNYSHVGLFVGLQFY